jgi:hypothetical protein
MGCNPPFPGLDAIRLSIWMKTVIVNTDILISISSGASWLQLVDRVIGMRRQQCALEDPAGCPSPVVGSRLWLCA